MQKHFYIALGVACVLTAFAPVVWGQAAPAPAPAPAAAPAPAPAPPVVGTPQQVDVSVKVVEFQTEKGVETGLSAYFAKRPEYDFFGRVTNDSGIGNIDVTFPVSATSGITVFLDNLRMNEGDLEVALQALANENRAYILSRPRAKVMVGDPTGMKIQTVQNVPYESTVVVGATAVQTTAFKDTGVMLQCSVPKVIDDDGDWSTTDDTFIQLNVMADVKEEGARLTIALDDQLAGGGLNFSQARGAITAPEFVSRSMTTAVWVRDGQVLILGGLYRNTKTKTLSTLPWLTQAEDLAVGMLERVVPGNLLGSPLSASIGNRARAEGRRELVFFIKCQTWRPAYTVADEYGLGAQQHKPGPKEAITGMLQEISAIPQGIAEGVKKETGGGKMESDLGGGPR